MKILLNKASLTESLRHFSDIGFVPTMGSIHKGHLSLISRSNQICHKTVVSIFINSKQFNNKKDFKTYPKNIKNKKNKNKYLLTVKDYFQKKYKIKIEYLELRDIKSLKLSNVTSTSRLFIAYYLNGVRLIDNL